MWLLSEDHYRTLLYRLNATYLAVRSIQQNQEILMSELDDLQNNFDALAAAVGVAVSDIGSQKQRADDLAKQVADLQAQLANGVPIDAAAVENVAQKAKALADNLTAAHTALSVAAPAPAPAPDPETTQEPANQG